MIYSTELIFHCYSPQLREFLEENGLTLYAKPFTHVRTNKVCWLFEKNEKLNLLLQEWSKAHK